MYNNIIELLKLKDYNLIISIKEITDKNVLIEVEHPLVEHFCPNCGFKMHSKGIRTRKVKHPILQDKQLITLLLKKRTWYCTNPECMHSFSDSFNFVEKYKRTTLYTDMMILEAFKDLNTTATSIANRFHLSDTHVLNVFDKYVDLDRLELSEIVSIDEVFWNYDYDSKYSLVLMDFTTGNAIDMLQSRRQEYTSNYFSSIPPKERYSVRFLVCDMYKPYAAYIKNYFPNAALVIDSFHVIQWILSRIMTYLRKLQRKHTEIHNKKVESISKERGFSVYIPDSDELYLLKKHKWVILSNPSNINYNAKSRYDKHFRCYMDTYKYEHLFLKIDSNLSKIRDLKNLYIEFNNSNITSSEEALEQLNLLIDIYRNSGVDMFLDFANLLDSFKYEISNSFIRVKKVDKNNNEYYARLSNGPIESMNRKAKDLKRNSRGIRNFKHARNRFLFANRTNPEILGYQKNNNNTNRD